LKIIMAFAFGKIVETGTGDGWFTIRPTAPWESVRSSKTTARAKSGSVDEGEATSREPRVGDSARACANKNSQIMAACLTSNP
jgi:hypothetical protein